LRGGGVHPKLPKNVLHYNAETSSLFQRQGCAKILAKFSRKRLNENFETLIKVPLSSIVGKGLIAVFLVCKNPSSATAIA